MRSKIARIIAFMLSCTLIGIFTYDMGIIADRSVQFDDEISEHIEYNRNITDTESEIYRRLWIVGTAYLRNLDENGKLKGTPEFKEQTMALLKKYDCIDDTGKIDLTGIPAGYKYSVSYGDRTYDHPGNGVYFEENSKYGVFRENDRLNFNGTLGWCYSTGSFNWFETNYGMTYYYIFGDGEAIYDFDTTGLDSYVDELGATLYYGKDGKLPVPYNYINYNELDEESDDYYVSHTVYGSDGEPIGEEIEERFDNEKFTKELGSEKELKISIIPNDELIGDLIGYLKKYDEQDQYIVHSLAKALPFVIAGLLIGIYYLFICGYSTKKKAYVMRAVDKIFGELLLLEMFAIIVAGVGIADGYKGFIDFWECYYTRDAAPFACAALYTSIYAVSLFSLASFVVRLRCHSLLKTTVIGRMLLFLYGRFKKSYDEFKRSRLTKEMLRNDRFTRSFIKHIVLAVVIELFFALITIGIEQPALFILCTVLVLGLYCYLSVGDLKALQRLNGHISDINAGDLTAHNEPESSPIHVPTEKLNNISAGLQTAVDRQIKSERMKIDLVTNVSHDLKTPLTSIISYIDLLSSEELTPEARDYVTIITEKADRLKSMVADLFDLAKATSRTDVSLEQIDLTVLTGQVLGDLADKIEASGKTIKTDIQTETAPVKADGKKMYRVFQNLIDNALKYSLDGTRIYLTLREIDGRYEVAVKNIASYEMTFSADEITERFTRGDESRSTEGNGLGLSIAKSFVEACGGEFSITIDGDLFTAKLKLMHNA